MLRHFYHVIGIFLFILASCSDVSNPSPFIITTKTDTVLPTSVNEGESTTAYYTVSNNTDVSKENNFVKYLPPNVAQVTSGGTESDTCTTTFTLQPKGESGSSCTLQLTITGSVDSSDTQASHHLLICVAGGSLCSGASDELDIDLIPAGASLTAISITPTSNSLQASQTQQFTATGTYSDDSTANITSSVTWNSSNEATAIISASGLATGVAAGTSDLSATLDSITSNTATMEVTPLFIYVTNVSNNSLSLCTVAGDTGELNNCSDSGVGAIFNSPVGVHLSVDEFFIYVVNEGNDTIMVCAVDTESGVLSGCTVTGSGFDLPSTIDFNATGTKAYIGNLGNSQVSVCDVDTSDGTLSACALTGSGFLTANDIALNASDTKAYIADFNSDAITLCTINGSTGLFDSCADSGAGSIFATTSSLALNASNTLAYVSYGGGAIDVCDIDATTGELSNCADSGGDIPLGVQYFTFNDSDSLMYMASSFFTIYTVTVCDVDEITGTLSGCADSAGDGTVIFSGPIALDLN